nr:hypothetical protein [Escherichia coli]
MRSSSPGHEPRQPGHGTSDIPYHVPRAPISSTCGKHRYTRPTTASAMPLPRRYLPVLPFDRCAVWRCRWQNSVERPIVKARYSRK